MKVKYVSEDGVSFDTKEECLTHENEVTNKYYTMYDGKGETDDVNDAIAVCFHYGHGYGLFIEANRNNDCEVGDAMEDTKYDFDRDGEEELGRPIHDIWYWDEDYERYNYLPCDIVDAIQSIH